MSEKLPELIDPVYCAQHHKAYAAQVKQTCYQRLTDQLVQADEWVKVSIKFYPYPGLAAYAFDLHLQTCLWLTCQRSLQPFGYPVDVELSGAYIESLALADDLPEDMAVFELPAEKVSLSALIEDELLLQVPLSPMDPAASLPDYEPAVPEWDLAQQQAGSDGETNPFAALKTLKPKH